MGSSKAFKYAYQVKQQASKGGFVDLFGCDTKLTAAQLEQMRLTYNTQYEANIQEIALVNQKTGVQVASSVDFKFSGQEQAKLLQELTLLNI